MKHVPVWIGAIGEDGRVHLRNPERYAAFVRTLGAGKEVEVVVRTRRRQRSEEANRYLWGVVLAMIAEHVGDEPEPVLRAMLGAWRGYSRSPATGLEVPNCVSSSSLTVREFHEFLEFCRRFALQQWGLFIPEPNAVEST